MKAQVHINVNPDEWKIFQQQNNGNCSKKIREFIRSQIYFYEKNEEKIEENEEKIKENIAKIAENQQKNAKKLQKYNEKLKEIEMEKLKESQERIKKLEEIRKISIQNRDNNIKVVKL